MTTSNPDPALNAIVHAAEAQEAEAEAFLTSDVFASIFGQDRADEMKTYFEDRKK